jgi:hypothetical protein
MGRWILHPRTLTLKKKVSNDRVWSYPSSIMKFFRISSQPGNGAASTSGTYVSPGNAHSDDDDDITTELVDLLLFKLLW